MTEPLKDEQDQAGEEKTVLMRMEKCVYCGKDTGEGSLIKIYEKYSCDKCAYQITGKKKPPRKEDPLRHQYKDLLNKLNR